MEEKESRISINIIEVLKDFLRKWWIILIASAVGAGAMIVYTYFTTEQKYTATAKMYVNNSSVSSSISDAISSVSTGSLQASRSLVNSYAVILKTHLILEDVLQTADIKSEKNPQKDKYTYGQLSSMISVGSVSNTEVCYIKVTCSDPEDAKRLANATLVVFKDQIGTIINGSSAKVVDYAVDASPVSRGFTKRGLIGFAVGFVLALAGIFIVDFYINDTFQSSDQLKQHLPENIPVLSVIPDTALTGGSKYSYYKKYSHYAHDYSYAYYRETTDTNASDTETGAASEGAEKK